MASIIGHVIIGILLVVAGVFAMKYNYQLTNSFGRFSFAERYLGSGGTFTFFKIMSVITIVLGLVVAFGLWGTLLEWALSPLAKILNLDS